VKEMKVSVERGKSIPKKGEMKKYTLYRCSYSGIDCVMTEPCEFKFPEWYQDGEYGHLEDKDTLYKVCFNGPQGITNGTHPEWAKDWIRTFKFVKLVGFE
jgi:hypothetical protein